ncbi:phospholipid/cholesterol/gamma-HCH transport system substrate-binding protein [Micromonospora echinaurantiaca]|uniref:Phospholipid/cholesterol/gamma-HCH transport system substrate-binding protein n=1 Tax=Micromonospora echinaurantiaca TaxID=47857 RepID=A0A1C5HQ14_9ACTN|nr:MCE family protein [Micromonospora echinaurantiaca]SCG47681.1 phospholipid/cholesterol/gamma-HCH transport system substrate-binding protein [Micromonospora echinaurantiaca]
MKPFRERNPVVTGAVGLTLIVAALLGAFQLDRLAAFTGRAYQAAFTDASGLAAGNEVRVAGVRVGKVTAVELARDTRSYVRVRFRVDDDGVRLGDRTGATIRIKTVLGQKYLALAPAGAGRLPEGGQIPLDRTAAPFDVVQAVTGLADTLDKVDTDQLAAAFATLSETFADTPASVDSALGGLARLSRTVADRDAELRSLLTRAREVTDVLATRDEEFRKLVTDGEALLAEVTRRRDAIHKLLVGTNDLATQLSGLVADNRTELDPALRELREVIAVLQRNRDNLERSIARMAPFVTAFANVVGNGRWFDSYVHGLVQPYVPTGGR